MGCNVYMYVKFEEFEERYFEITFDEITNTNILYVMFSSEIKFRLREVGSIVLLFNVGKK